MRRLNTVFLILAGLALVSCGGGRQPSGVPSLSPTPPEVTLEATLAELDALAAPEGVNPSVFAQLKAALRAALTARGAESIGPPPQPPEVDDLKLTDHGDGTYTLTWSYQNRGDYDQNGEVNLADIVPIAVHFHKTPASPDWSVAEVADGDGNNEVNLGDVITIAVNFRLTCAGYSILRSVDYPPGEFKELAKVGLSFATGDGRKQFSWTVASGTYRYFAVAPYDRAGEIGSRSNVVELPLPNQPPVANITANPAGGPAPLTVVFDASASTDSDGTIASYDYDWEGDGSYDLINGGATPSHTYGDVGGYNATVRVTDDDGAKATASVTITVSDGQAPSVSVTAPADGADFNIGDSTAFTADATDNVEVIQAEFYIKGALYYVDTAAPWVAPDYTFGASSVGQVAFEVIAYDAKGNQASDTNTVTVNPPPGTWHFAFPDISGDVGRYTSLAVVNGNPAISYYDYTNRNLKFVRAASANGESWSTPPVTVDDVGSVGEYTSLAVVNGNPAISYYDNTNPNEDLKFVRAIDANGDNWGPPVIVDGTKKVGEYTSLAIVNGNPAISYYDAINGDLKFVRAVDANGGSWSTPITVDDVGSVGKYTSLAVVNGNPAISYCDWTNGYLKYVRATDANGEGWGTPVTADMNGVAMVGLFTSLAVVNGNPAISHFDTTNHELRYVRSTDPNGTNWGPPVIVDDTGYVGEYTSLVVVGGKPAISYYDHDNTNLKFVRAADANGESWGTPVTVDNAGSVGEYTSLAIVNGNPAISYYGSDKLKFAIYY